MRTFRLNAFGVQLDSLAHVSQTVYFFKLNIGSV